MAAAVSDVRRLAPEFTTGPAAPAWVAGSIAVGQYVLGGGNVFVCLSPGATGASQPTWPSSGTVVDGGVTWSFWAAGPYVCPVSDADLSAWLTDAAIELVASVWGSLYNRAQALLAAHFCAVAHPELTTGESDKVGDLQKNYVKATGPDGGYEQTRYGRDYRRMLRRLGLGIQII